MSEKRFKVALSFPGEKRDFIRQVADELAAKLGREKILYDDYLTAELAQFDLDLHLANLYRNESELLVPFFCADYERKEWCKLEWRQMRDILHNMEGSRIMPFRFDDSEISGVLSIDGYVKIEKRTPKEVAELILQRVEKRPTIPRPAGNKTPNRKFWLWGILATIILLCAFFLPFHHSLPPKPFSSDVTGILILRLAGDTDNSLRNRLLYSLDDAIGKDSTIQTKLSDEVVDENEEPAKAHERAREIGKKWNARLVVWGNKTDEARFFPRITTVRSDRLPTSLDNFRMQSNL